MMRRALALAALSIGLTGCVTDRQTDTARSATEELLTSAAADRAAEALSQRLPTGSRMFVDTSDFDAVDGKYAIGAIRDALLRHGDRLVDQKAAADIVLDLRAGALATDDHEFLIGIPSFTVPIPLAGSFSLPKVAFYDDTDQKGVAKFAATGLDAKTGALVVSAPPQYGYAHNTKHIVMLFFSWTRKDMVPPAQQDAPDR